MATYILQKRNKTGSNKEFSRIFSFRKKGVNPIDVTFFGDDYNFDQVQKKNSEDSNIENSGWNASSNSKRHSRDKFLNTPCFIPRVIHSFLFLVQISTRLSMNFHLRWSTKQNKPDMDSSSDDAHLNVWSRPLDSRGPPSTRPNP